MEKDKDYVLDDCTQAFRDAEKQMNKEKQMKLFRKIKDSFKKETYEDKSKYRINISILLATVVLFCLACVFYFL